MLKILFSPHMTSVDNEAKRASGHADVPLSVQGEARARELGGYYRAESFAAVFSSDLQRAAVTSSLAFEDRNVPRFVDARLRECDYGRLTQYPVAQIDAEFLKRISEPFPDGESVFSVVQRVGEFLRDVTTSYEGATIVVIAHRAPRYAMEFWCGSESLDTIVNSPLEWLDTPIWRFTLDESTLVRRAEQLSP